MNNQNKQIILIGNLHKNQKSQSGNVFSTKGVAPTITAGTHGYCLGAIVYKRKNVK